MRQVILSDSNRQAIASSKLLRGALPPADKVNGPVRMIEIEGVDINACGGYALLHSLYYQTQLAQMAHFASHVNAVGSHILHDVFMRGLSVRVRQHSSLHS